VTCENSPSTVAAAYEPPPIDCGRGGGVRGVAALEPHGGPRPRNQARDFLRASAKKFDICSTSNCRPIDARESRDRCILLDDAANAVFLHLCGTSSDYIFVIVE
jgi:hypothetical protein